MTFIEKRFQRGVARLDSKTPDWWKRVDPDTIDLTSSRMCVLGQVYHGVERATGFATGMRLLWPFGLRRINAVRCGFDGTRPTTRVLERLWAEEVRKRRRAERRERRVKQYPPTRLVRTREMHTLIA